MGTKPQTWDEQVSAALWAYRTSFKTSLGYTPFYLIYGHEALLPIEVELASLRVLCQDGGGVKEHTTKRLLELERLSLNREEAITSYAMQVEKQRQRFNKKLLKKDIEKGSLVLRYDNRFDNRKDGKFSPHWEGPFKVVDKFSNGYYQLMGISGKVHKTWVNGWRLKPYHPRIFS